MHPLDNPFWSSLQTRHGALALQAGDVARYPPAYAPFLGVRDAGAGVDDALRALVPEGESVYLLGIVPRVPRGWVLEDAGLLAQMACPAELDIPDGPDIIELGESHRADILALTALVYPHFFRERTMELGRYFGIYEDGRLAAMIGERLGDDRHQEMSAICTHPDFTGRGYARRLTAVLTNETLARGRRPYLHVSHANTRARALYERMGYALRRDIPFWSLARPAAR